MTIYGHSRQGQQQGAWKAWYSLVSTFEKGGAKVFQYINSYILAPPFLKVDAKHLDAGSSLEPLLPLTVGNSSEELG